MTTTRAGDISAVAYGLGTPIPSGRTMMSSRRGRRARRLVRGAGPALAAASCWKTSRAMPPRSSTSKPSSAAAKASS
ncbi:MAG: hypothetical protein E6I33_01975 [Chloroflexi bacterium]|nr:MAG: hypothetical protein E6I33_01975 [Chloroflexota bacterium]